MADFGEVLPSFAKGAGGESYPSFDKGAGEETRLLCLETYIEIFPTNILEQSKLLQYYEYNCLKFLILNKTQS